MANPATANFDLPFTMRLARESWSLYAVGMVMIALRLYARIRRLGIINLQADDYLTLLAVLFYTGLIVSLNIVTAAGGSNLYPPGLEASFTPADIHARIFGSKIVVVSEQAMLNVIYTLKTCMLLMYVRLTTGLHEARGQVRVLVLYVAAGYVATQIAFFTACRPFAGYWALPPPDPQCTTLQHFAIVQGVFNMSADALMLGVPIPLVVRMRLPWRQKIVLVLIFSLGVFVVVAALLTKIFNLTDVYSPKYMLWYVREASVAVYVSNLPMIWPLLREWFPSLQALSPGLGPSRRYTKSERKKSLKSAYHMSRASTAKVRLVGSKERGFSVMATKRETLTAYADIEMAMATHGMGLFVGDRSFSDEDDLRTRAETRSDNRTGSSVVDKDRQLPGPQGPNKVLSRPKSIYETNSAYVITKMENQARQEAVQGIQVHTVVEVRETQVAEAQQRSGDVLGCEVKICGGTSHP